MERNVLALVTATGVFIVYFLCLPSSVGYWDSGEFIASSYKLQVSHPPGASFYTLVNAALLGLFSVQKVAFVSHVISAFWGALSTFMLFNITWKIAERLEIKAPTFLLFSAAFLASTSMAFMETFWGSSVVTEVYTMSFAFFLGLFWVTLEWFWTNEKHKEQKLLLLFCLLYGLSATIHLINLAIIIPVSVLVVKKKFRFSFFAILIGVLASIIMFFFIQGVLIKGVLKLGHVLDVFFVNQLGTSVNVGMLFLVVLIGVMLLSLFFFSVFKKKFDVRILSLGLLFFYLGLLPYTTLIIRGMSQPSITNDTATSQKLLDYITASQFGVDKIPLLYGENYTAPLDAEHPYSEGKAMVQYDSKSKKYRESIANSAPVLHYDERFKTFFPRMYHTHPLSISGYNSWTKVKGKEVAPELEGNTLTPTFKENFNFFLNYQLYWLNLRYFLWNFAGRQNHYKANGTIKYGNWQSGFSFIDHSIFGKETFISTYLKETGTSFYLIPLFLGLIGFFAFRKHYALLLTLLLMFLTFGVGITLFVNPTPLSLEIRERDYIFLGANIIFCIWIGGSVLVLYRLFTFIENQHIRTVMVTVLCVVGCPLLFLVQGYSNQKKDDSLFVKGLAKLFLDSCPKDGILITNGDNTTFPLWYLQEVEGYRTDVRVVNFEMLKLDWYVESLNRKQYDSERILLRLDRSMYSRDKNYRIPLNQEVDRFVDVPLLMDFLSDHSKGVEINSKKRKYFPSSKFSIAVDSIKVAAYLPKSVTQFFRHKYVNRMNWNYRKASYSKGELAVLDVISSNINERPICFANIGDKTHFLGLEQYMLQRGLVGLLAPYIKANQKDNPKIIDFETSTKLFYDPQYFSKVAIEDLSDVSKTYVQNILRRNHYFLAQGFEEYNLFSRGLNVLDKSIALFPNEKVPFAQYAFNMGKLYNKMRGRAESKELCFTTMKNFKSDLDWLVSFDPPNKIRNVQYLKKKVSMYEQMLQESRKIYHQRARELKAIFDEEFMPVYESWLERNDPYSKF